MKKQITIGHDGILYHARYGRLHTVGKTREKALQRLEEERISTRIDLIYYIVMAVISLTMVAVW